MLTSTKCIPSVIGFLLILADLCGDVYGVDLDQGNSCKMNDGRVGVCTKLQECESIQQALKMPGFSLRNLVQCPFPTSEEVVCCPDKTPTNLRQTRALPASRIGDRKASIACMTYSQNANKFLSTTPLKSNQDPTYPGEFPHMAGLGYPLADGVSFEWNCAGFLISDRYVLTAAHCVSQRKPTLIRLGSTNLDKITEKAIDVGVELITLHPQYMSSRRYHNIALIRLNITVQFSDLIRPACLYTDLLDVQPNTRVVFTGWGAVYSGGVLSPRSSSLKKIYMTPFGLESCNQTLVEYGLSRALPTGLNQGHLCAVALVKENDVCQGDSGGPLQITTKPGVHTVVGVSSFGFFCASGMPNVFSRVAFYLDWIESIVWP